MTARRMPFDDLARLAAAHAALDPDRQKWRNDILISSLIEILALKGPQYERDLRLHIKNMWLTDVVDKRPLHVALELAEEAGLIEGRQHSRNAKWAAMPGSVVDAKADHAWAETIIERFERDLGKRLPELLDNHEVIEPARQRRLAQYLISALMAGSQRVFKGVILAGDPESLNGIDFDLSAAYAQLQARVLPGEVANALKALTQAAFDTADNFGTEILRLIVAGQVLQGMLGHRDLTGLNWVEGSTLVLDTSVLVYRLDSNGPQSRLLEELLQMSRDVHCNIVVTRAVINEWNRLWQSAANDAQALAARSTDLPQQLIRLAKNPMLRNWQSRAEHGRPVTWTEFERRYNHLESWLANHRIQIIDDEQADPALVERMRAELLTLSAAAKKPMRTEAAALTDAVSAAIVAKARNLNFSLAPTAWFIAEDRFTDEAYHSIWPKDKFPVASTIEVWLLLLSRARADDPGRAGNLAGTIGDAVIQKSFLAVSAGYSVSELIKITDILNTAPSADAESLGEDVRTDYLALARLSGPDVPAELLRRRALRRDWQVQRRERQVNEMTQDMDDRIQEAEKLAENLKTANVNLKTANVNLQAANVRMQRTFWLVIALFLMASMVGGAAALGAHLWLVVGGAVLCVAVGLEGFRWKNQPDVRASRFIIGIAATISWVILGGVISVILP